MKLSKAFFNKYNQKDEKTIAFDLDGTLAEYHGSDSFKEGKVGDLLPGIDELLSTLHDKGYKIIIFTSRQESEKEAIEKWIKDNKLPINEVITNKPHYEVLIDDKNIRFNGKVDKLEDEILNFKPWWESETK